MHGNTKVKNGGFCLRNVHKLATRVNQFLFVNTETSGHRSSPAELPCPKQTYQVLGMPPRFFSLPFRLPNFNTSQPDIQSVV